MCCSADELEKRRNKKSIPTRGADSKENDTLVSSSPHSMNKKILALTGDTILAGAKAEKILGDDQLSLKQRKRMEAEGL